MRKTMWQLLTATRGGTNRVRIIRALDEQPRNANQLAEDIGQDYNTIRYHLDMLVDNDILETEDSDYAKSYFLTDQFERHRKEYERILQTMD
ncbi:winged helix-turn-helix domain-containing protein [Haladaptatus sp. DFWS20]|uniref:winged helix-turn-helix domain-containing protein n=1 Tax=Haladaptatus sp. DFWS20 TaxID=3403467 RepID=UPI003EC0878B